MKICETCENWKHWKGSEIQSSTFGECTVRTYEDEKPYISADVETCDSYSPKIIRSLEETSESLGLLAKRMGEEIEAERALQ